MGGRGRGGRGRGKVGGRVGKGKREGRWRGLVKRKYGGKLCQAGSAHSSSTFSG